MNSGRMSGYGERVLFIGAHPDDIEIGCGGTAAKFIGEGKAIAFAIASFHPVDGKIREAEAKEAASKLGLLSFSQILSLRIAATDTITILSSVRSPMAVLGHTASMSFIFLGPSQSLHLRRRRLLI